MAKLLVRRLFFGIACGCVIFVINGIWTDLTRADVLSNYLDSFTANALGSMVVGAAFSVSTIAYTVDRLASWLQIAINVFVGFGVYFLVAFLLGWITVVSPIIIISLVVTNAFIFVVIGIGSYLLDGREAKIINEKLKQRDSV